MKTVQTHGNKFVVSIMINAVKENEDIGDRGKQFSSGSQKRLRLERNDPDDNLTDARE